MDRISIKIQPSFLFLIILFIIFLPLKLTGAWLIAAIVHELGHILLLLLLHKQIYCICIGFNGAIIQTEALGFWEESIVGIAGPCAGLLLLIFVRYIPVIAICAMIQSVYNLLPFYPMDGGRAVLGFLRAIAGNETGFKIYCVYILLLSLLAIIFVIYFSFQFSLGCILFIVPIFLIVKVKLACKDRRQAVQ